MNNTNPENYRPHSKESSQPYIVIPKINIKLTRNNSILLLVGGVAVMCVCIACLVIGAGLMFFNRGNPITSIVTQKPPHYGIYLKTSTGLTELQMLLGKLPDVTVSTQETQPTIVVWLKDVNLELLNLTPKDETLNPMYKSLIAYTTTPKGDGVIEIVPKQALPPGEYCITQGNIMLPPQQIPYSCFGVLSIGGTPITEAPGQPVVVTPPPTPTRTKPATGLQALRTLLAQAQQWRQDVQIYGMSFDARAGMQAWTLGTYSPSAKARREYAIRYNSSNGQGTVAQGGITPLDSLSGTHYDCLYLTLPDLERTNTSQCPMLDVSSIKVDTDAAEATARAAMGSTSNLRNISLSYGNKIVGAVWRIAFEDGSYAHLRADNGMLLGHSKDQSNPETRALKELLQLAQAYYPDTVLCFFTATPSFSNQPIYKTLFLATTWSPSRKDKANSEAIWDAGLAVYDASDILRAEYCTSKENGIAVDKVKVNLVQLREQAISTFGEGRDSNTMYDLVQGANAPQWRVDYQGRRLIIDAMDGHVIQRP